MAITHRYLPLTHLIGEELSLYAICVGRIFRFTIYTKGHQPSGWTFVEYSTLPSNIVSKINILLFLKSSPIFILIVYIIYI